MIGISLTELPNVVYIQCLHILFCRLVLTAFQRSGQAVYPDPSLQRELLHVFHHASSCKACTKEMQMVSSPNQVVTNPIDRCPPMSSALPVLCTGSAFSKLCCYSNSSNQFCLSVNDLYKHHSGLLLSLIWDSACSTIYLHDESVQSSMQNTTIGTMPCCSSNICGKMLDSRVVNANS